MAGKLARSWDLVKASATVLQADKKLLLFPLLSTLCTLIVAASFIVPAILGGAIGAHAHESMTPFLWLLTFVFYVVQYSVIFFFNSALVGTALACLDGEQPSFADGLHLAMSRLPAIVGYALIAATVGMLLRALQQRAGFIGRWVIGLLGVAWTAATFLTVPVLVSQNIGPIDAVKRSAELLKRTWGENLAGNIGMGAVAGIASMLVIAIGLGLGLLAAQTGSMVLVGFVVALVIVAVMLIALVQSALQGIYAAALYRYATTGTPTAGFDHALVANAFQVKA